jgi:hypothetical protein
MAGILGLDPNQTEMLSQALLGLGAGMAGGRNWREGIAGGLAGAAGGVQQARQNLRNDRILGLEEQRYGREEADWQAKQKQAAARAAFIEQAMPSLTPEQQAAARAAPDEFWTAYSKHLYAEPEAPKTRDVRIGTQQVTQQWDPVGRSWTEVGRGPAWAPPQPTEGDRVLVQVADPSSPTGSRWVTRGQAVGKPSGAPGGGLTLPEQANNAEIDRSRQYFLGNNLSRDDIAAKTLQFDPQTGLPNPAYDATTARLFSAATQHKVGQDDLYGTFMDRYYPSGPGASPAAGGASPAAAPAPAAATGAGAPSAAPATPPAAPAAPRSLPRDLDGSIRQQSLVKGQSYTVPGPNGGPPEVRVWDGTHLVRP